MSRMGRFKGSNADVILERLYSHFLHGLTVNAKALVIPGYERRKIWCELVNRDGSSAQHCMVSSRACDIPGINL